MAVLGAAGMLSDEWLLCEDNAHAADWLFQWLASVRAAMSIHSTHILLQHCCTMHHTQATDWPADIAQPADMHIEPNAIMAGCNAGENPCQCMQTLNIHAGFCSC